MINVPIEYAWVRVLSMIDAAKKVELCSVRSNASKNNNESEAMKKEKLINGQNV